jgi:hypothetical protein
MKFNSDDIIHDSSQARIGRRTLLASLAVAGAGGLAGCPDVTVNIGDGGGDGSGGDGDGVFDDSGDDSGSDGSDGSESGSDGGSGDRSCTDIANGYEFQDVGARPVIFDFEYPAVFGNLEYVQGGPLVIYEAEQSIGDGLLLDIRINQVTDPSQSVGMADQGASGATITFNGEEVEFVGTSSASSLGWVGNLPYQFDGERRTFSTTLELTSDRESNECGDALREAAEHIVNSMELNAETTL